MISVFLENGQVAVRHAPTPRRPEGYSLIRLLAAGICNTDLELRRGYYGFRGRPGHEFVGEVVESDNRALAGKRVVGEINLACTKCDWCLRGLGRHCPKRSVLGIVRHPGAFAGFLTLPDRNLHVVPDSVPNEHAVFAEPIAAACEILDQVAIPKRSTVAVLGDGKLGLLIAQVLQLHGAAVTHFGRHKKKLMISGNAGVATELVGRKKPKACFDYVVEATGSSKGLQSAVHMARQRGTVVMKSTVHDRVAIDAAPIVVNELTLVGSRCGRMEAALPLLKQRKLRLDEMISDWFPLSRAPAAFDRAAQSEVLKVILTT